MNRTAEPRSARVAVRKAAHLEPAHLLELLAPLGI
jgi:hypothetical protein